MNRPGISTREHAAMSGLGQTSISSSAVRMLNLTFIATILVVPLVQLVVGPGNRPGFGRLISLPGLQDSGRDSAGNNVLERILAVNSKLLKEIQLFEQRIEDESVLSRVLLGPTQHWMTRLTGVGNEQVYSGSDGWLFYRPDVDYITGPGFLDPAVLAKRADSGNEHARAPQPDPRKALRQFKRQLETRGIQLIVMPMPIKPMLRPEKLSSRYDDQPSVLQNVSYDRFKAELEAEGFLVFDVADSLFHREWRTSHSVFLKTDTHWSNLSVERTARQLSAFIHETAHLAPPDKVVYRFESDHVLNQGDLAAMLDMSGDKQLYGLEEVRTRRILQSDGALWEPTESADILLLGDSFTNIYSLPEMAWGDAAGLAEQLSFEMQRPIDRNARNAERSRLGRS